VTLGRKMCVVVAGVVPLIVGLASSTVFAGTGLNMTYWGQPNYVISTSVHPISNVVGFWQTVSVSFACSDKVDGYFTPTTASITREVQGRLGISQTGVVSEFTWNSAMAFSPPGYNGALGLQPTGPVAYTYQNYNYYAGGGTSVLLRWSAYFGQWGFNANVNGLNWQSATSARTGAYSYSDPFRA
jgi:hypothetical protein